MAVRKTSKNSALTLAPQTPKTPTSVYAHTVIMSDDSMAPIFVKGDLVTINQDLSEEKGDYVLVRTTMERYELHVIRRYDGEPLGDRSNYVPENPAYPEMLEDEEWANLECLGPVTSVQHVDGTIETFDLSTRKRLEEYVPVEAVCV
jgi:SOS-response transcriptional repressor LexA